MSEFNPTSEPEAASSRYERDRGQETSARKFRRVVAVDALLTAGVKGNAQHVGVVLAHKTPSTGQVEMLQAALCELVGMGKDAVRLALRELAELGFLEVRRRGSVANVFTWKEKAYTDPRISLLAHNAPREQGGAEDAPQRTAWEAVWRCWLAERELRHQIPATVGWGQARRLSEHERAEVAGRVLLLAQKSQRVGEPLEVAIERAASVALRYWVRERPGNKDFLVNERHPLWRIVQDLDDVTAVAAQRLRRPAVATEPKQDKAEPVSDKRDAFALHAARITFCDECHFASDVGHNTGCSKSTQEAA